VAPKILDGRYVALEVVVDVGRHINPHSRQLLNVKQHILPQLFDNRGRIKTGGSNPDTVLVAAFDHQQLLRHLFIGCFFEEEFNLEDVGSLDLEKVRSDGFYDFRNLDLKICLVAREHCVSLSQNRDAVGVVGLEFANNFGIIFVVVQIPVAELQNDLFHELGCHQINLLVVNLAFS
jgi:hypothetical protein